MSFLSRFQQRWAFKPIKNANFYINTYNYVTAPPVINVININVWYSSESKNSNVYSTISCTVHTVYVYSEYLVLWVQCTHEGTTRLFWCTQESETNISKSTTGIVGETFCPRIIFASADFHVCFHCCYIPPYNLAPVFSFARLFCRKQIPISQ